MTIDEAREILEKLIPQPQRGDGKSITHLMITEALNMAIEVLEQQPCEDCISREAVLDILCENKEYYQSESQYDRIEKLPSVQPTRPKGKWIILDECANEGVYCSECHKKVFKLEFSHTMKWRNFKYCPNCGVDMKESDK